MPDAIDLARGDACELWHSMIRRPLKRCEYSLYGVSMPAKVVLHWALGMRSEYISRGEWAFLCPLLTLAFSSLRNIY